MVEWRGKIWADKVSDIYVSSTDIFPSILEAVGYSQPKGFKIDGISVLDKLLINPRGKSSSSLNIINGDERIMYWFKDLVSNYYMIFFF